MAGAGIGVWRVADFGDAERADGADGLAIVCPGLEGEDLGIRIYVRADDPLAHAREIAAALNDWEARKRREEEHRA